MPDAATPCPACGAGDWEERAFEAAARMPLAPLSLTVDGEPVAFLRAGDDGAWAAVARPVEGRTLYVAVAARGPAPALETLAGIEPYGALPIRWPPVFEDQSSSAS